MRIEKKLPKLFLVTLLCFFIAQERLAMAKQNEIQLPKPRIKGEMSLEEAILKRRSQRSFTKTDLTQAHLSQLLWAAQGITGSKYGFDFRAAPSAGALYPMELYVLSKDGLFHYIPQGHKLEALSNKDLRKGLAGAALGQHAIADAPVDIVICAIYSRVTSKYKEHGTRYVHIEAGHIAQNIHLQAAALGLGSVPIGAFDDEAVKRLLKVPGGHEPLYVIPVGFSE